MSKYQKLIDKLNAERPPSDIRWSELCSFLEHLGYSKLPAKGGGSRRKFYHQGKKAMIACHQPHPNPCVGKATIVDIIEHLKERGFI